MLENQDAIDLVEKSNWTSKALLYLKNVFITEYDLKSGGLSVIKENSLLNNDVIEKLSSMEKEKRNIIIGKLQIKYPDLSAKMVEGFASARKTFVDKNNIKADQILSIKKDALFLINPKGIIEQVTPNLLFRAKNTYTSYLNINRKEFYYSPSLEFLEVKGIPDEIVQKQNEYLLKDMLRFMRQAEKITAPVLFSSLREYQSKYLKRELPTETYRNLENGKFSFDGYDMDEIDAEDIENVDISKNYTEYVLPMIRQLLLLD
jgi:hypothetical protein